MAETINPIKNTIGGAVDESKLPGGDAEAHNEGVLQAAKDKTEQLRRKMRRLLGDDI